MGASPAGTKISVLQQDYKKGTEVYVRDEVEAWVRAEVTSIAIDTTLGKIAMDLKHKTENPKMSRFEATLREVLETNTKELPPLCDPPGSDGIDDLTNLSHLHEPAVLDNLRLRYKENDIYTYSGIVLVALNPFARVDRYSQHELETYAGRARGELQPHLFAIAEDTYQGMIRNCMNQTIIVSGESGAGKTMSARYIMRYFATAHEDSRASFSAPDHEGATAGSGAAAAAVPRSIEDQIMATNPVLESFGNAKTTRNDNSSRFGKYLEIHFNNDSHAISGASIRTYLLERSRLVFQPKTERNYHIFYQLLATAVSDPARLKGLGLSGGWGSFHYTRQGGEGCGVIPDVDDALEFTRTCEAMALIGIDGDTQSTIFTLLAALLHLGNIEVKGTARSGASIDDDDPAFAKAADLLQVDAAAFKKWLTRKQTVTTSEKIVSNLTREQAIVVRDSVAKYIYVHLFSWMVHILNESLGSGPGTDHSGPTPFIGVLDIYGFEHFEVNSFEQFCINYANEKLQRHFNRHVFQLEQEEYAREGLSNWTFVDFHDNKPCIELIEGKTGILNMLDDVCRSQRTDEDFVGMLYQIFTPSDDGPKRPKDRGQQQQQQQQPAPAKRDRPQGFFGKPRFDNHAFIVRHYAHEVTYKAKGFVEKNKDTVPDEVQEVLKASKFGLLARIFEHASEKEEEQKKKAADAATSAASKKTGSKMLIRRGTIGQRKPTLGAEFRVSLIELMQKIASTQTHYIRCIKPNEHKRAWEFDSNLVLAQLRACGVLETIRISSAGYPSRVDIPEFINAYAILSRNRPSSYEDKEDVRNFVRQILKESIADEDKYQVGHTKVFFRAGTLAYLQKLRAEKRSDSAVYIQKMSRMFLARRHFLRQRAAATQLQTAARLFMARGKLRELRQASAAVTIQKHVRGFLARRQYTSTVRSTILVQSAVHGWPERKQYCELRRERAAVKIQAVWHGFLARRWSAAKREAIIRTQSYLRTKKAKLEYIQLKAHAKSAAHFKEVTYKLEGKVIELTRQIEISETACKSLRSKNRRLEDLCSQLESQLVAMKDEAKRSAESSKERIESLEQELNQLKIDHINLAKERDKLASEVAQMRTKANARLERERARTDQSKHALAGVTGKLETVKVERDKYREKADRFERLLLELRQHPLSSDGLLTGNAGDSSENDTAASAVNKSSDLSMDQDQFSLPSALDRKHSHRNLTETAEISGYVHTDSKTSPYATIGVGEGPITPPISSDSDLSMYQNDEACARGSYNLERFGVGAGTIHQLQAKQQQQIPALLSAQATNPREPTSRLIHNETKSAPDSPWEIVLHNEQEVCRMLECDRNLTTEILDEIIDKTQVPPLDLRISYSQPEMLFPAHLIGLCVIKMFQYNLTARIDRLLELVISRVQKRACAFWSDQETAFWLSNVFELLSIIKTSVSDHQMASEVYFESERAMSSGMQGLELLLSDIYFGWVKRLQKRMSGLIIPSIVEHQELYNYQDSDGILSRMMGSASKSSEVKLAHILAFLNSVREVMVFYYVDVAIMKQIISDLLCTVGATAFNNLIARRNFCSSNRGMQIQYNVSKIEEWCKLHEVSDKTQNLDRLLQLAKVLQMHKETPEDLEIIREVSDLLTPAQIKQILKSYKPADSEAPIPSSLIHHPMLSSSSSTGYLLNTGDMTDQVLFLTARKVPAIETFIPHHITARRIRALIDSQTQTPQEGEEEEYEPYYKDSLEDENFTLPPSEYHQNQVLNDRGLDFPRGTMVEPVLDTNTLAAMYERW